jgi:UDP-GlcNAc3NAcA epimerase
MKIITVIGTRPQFIKSVPVSIELKKNKISEVIINTGQHFDHNMSAIFFDQLGIVEPKYQLKINSLSHGAMTGKMLEKIEEVLIQEKPDFVLVYGDTNSTLAGALAASKLQIKIVHIEAGLRSFNMNMPEEINRIVTDRLSAFLFCPTLVALRNLRKEGFLNHKCKIVNSGDVMLDAVNLFSQIEFKSDFGFENDFILCTIHRQENTDSERRLKSIFKAINTISEDKKVILPVHPRTRRKLQQYEITQDNFSNIVLIEPVGYLEMLYLLRKCSFVITDSGGLQKEAFFFKKLCLTLRDETEWIELVEYGFNFVAGANYEEILKNYAKLSSADPNFDINLYGDGKAATRIVTELLG